MSLLEGYRRFGALAALDAVRTEYLFRLEPISSAIRSVALSLHQLNYPMRIDCHAMSSLPV